MTDVPSAQPSVRHLAADVRIALQRAVLAGPASVFELARRFGVSRITARRHRAVVIGLGTCPCGLPPAHPGVCRDRRTSRNDPRWALAATAFADLPVSEAAAALGLKASSVARRRGGARATLPAAPVNVSPPTAATVYLNSTPPSGLSSPSNPIAASLPYPHREDPGSSRYGYSMLGNRLARRPDRRAPATPVPFPEVGYASRSSLADA